MIADKVFVAKILILYLGLALGGVYLGVTHLLGKEKFLWKGKNRPRVVKLLGVVSLLMAIWLPSEIVMDVIQRDVKEKIIEVHEVMSPTIPAVWKNRIVTKEDGVFSNMFKKFELIEKQKYKIKYFPRTKILVEVESLNDKKPIQD